LATPTQHRLIHTVVQNLSAGNQWGNTAPGGTPVYPHQASGKPGMVTYAANAAGGRFDFDAIRSSEQNAWLAARTSDNAAAKLATQNIGQAQTFANTFYQLVQFDAVFTTVSSWKLRVTDGTFIYDLFTGTNEANVSRSLVSHILRPGTTLYLETTGLSAASQIRITAMPWNPGTYLFG
jgi:hypothetical protein